MKLTWIQISLDARIVENGNIWPSLAECKNLDTLSVTSLTSQNTINTLSGAIRQISKPICHNLKQSRMNYTPIHSNAWIAKMIIRPTLIHVHSGGTASTENSTQRNIRKSKKSGRIQFTYLWARFKYDFKEYQALFSKFLKEQNFHK